MKVAVIRLLAALCVTFGTAALVGLDLATDPLTQAARLVGEDSPLQVIPPDPHARFFIEASGDEAVIWVDGYLRGMAPYAFEVMCDTEIEIVIRAQGYARWRQVVPCRPGALQHVTAELVSSEP